MTLVLENLSLPARIRPDAPMSDDELMHFCARYDNLRIEREPNGELSIMTPSGSNTSRMNSRVTRILDEWAEADGRGQAFDSNGGFRLPDNSVRAADAAWVGHLRWNKLTEEQRKGFAPICPDFIIELRSPTDKLPDLESKMEQWIANGAEVAWLIDPISRAVSIYRRGDEHAQQPELLADPTSVQGTGPIAGFELVMQRIWG